MNSALIIDSLRQYGLLVLEIPLPHNDDGLPQLLVGEEGWSCSVVLDGIEVIVPLEGPNAGQPIHINELIKNGLLSVRRFLGESELQNDRFRNIRNTDEILVDYLTEGRLRRSVIWA